MPEMTFNPDADPETSSVDGYVRNFPNGASWATTRAGAGNDSNDTGDDLFFRFHSHSVANEWRDIIRGLLVFDINALPGGTNITGVTLSLYNTGNGDALNIGANFRMQVYSASPALDTALADGDFDSFGSTEWSDNGLAHPDVVNNAYNDIVFNTDGISAVETAVSGDGIVRIGLREKYYDVDGNVPPWSNFVETNLNMMSADDSSANPPKLTVTYTGNFPTGNLTRVTGLIHGYFDKSPDPRLKYSITSVLGGISPFYNYPWPGFAGGMPIRAFGFGPNFGFGTQGAPWPGFPRVSPGFAGRESPLGPFGILRGDPDFPPLPESPDVDDVGLE